MERVPVMEDGLIKELSDAAKWRRFPGNENHLATAKLFERAVESLLAIKEELRKQRRETQLALAQVDRFMTWNAAICEVVDAAEALGAMPEGYCFCSKDRIGDDSKIHEPECADLRAAIAKARA